MTTDEWPPLPLDIPTLEIVEALLRISTYPDSTGPVVASRYQQSFNTWVMKMWKVQGRPSIMTNERLVPGLITELMRRGETGGPA